MSMRHTPFGTGLDPHSSPREASAPNTPPAGLSGPLTLAGGASIPMASIEAVAEERRRQIHEFGHTPERDAELTPAYLYNRAARYGRQLREGLDCNAPHATLRRYATVQAALLIALIDRLDHPAA